MDDNYQWSEYYMCNKNSQLRPWYLFSLTKSNLMKSTR